MSSKRRSYDTDEITLRKVFAKSAVDNTTIGGMKVLTSDGTGGTYWAIPSTLGYNPSFNQINTTASNFTADLSYNIFTMNAESGIGFSAGPGANELNIYGKAFNQIDVSGNNTLYGFTSNVVTPTVKLAGTGGITLLSDPGTNTLFITSQGIQVSSSQFSFQKVQVYSNASTLIDNLNLTNSVILNAASPSSVLKYVGLSDILLSTNTTNNIIYYSLRTNTGTISSLTASISNVSTNYVKKTDFSTATNALASTSFGYYSYLSTLTIDGLSSLSTAVGGATINLSTFNLSTTNLYTSTITFNDINTSAEQVMAVSSGVLVLNGQGITGVGDVTQENLVSTVAGLGTVGYISTGGLVSTVAGLGTVGYISTGGLVSTVAGLGTVGYISTGGLVSTIAGLGTAGYISTSGLVSSIGGLGTAGYISTSGLVSTIEGLGTIGYVSTSGLVSTVIGLGTAGYISSLSTFILSTGWLKSGITELSTLNFKDTADNNIYVLNSSNGSLYLNGTPLGSGTVINNTNISTYIYQLSSVSTLIAYSDFINISTVQNAFLSPEFFSTKSFSTGDLIVSSVSFKDTLTNATQYLAVANNNLQLNNSNVVLQPDLVSTVIGLGTAGYISSTQLTSSIAGVYTSINDGIDASELTSSIIGLGTAGYISSSQLTSSMTGVYTSINASIDVAELTSSIMGLGSAGYISSSQLTSTITGVYTSINASIDASELTSSIIGLGTARYISSSQLTSSITGVYTAINASIDASELTSSIIGLGTARYISSSQLTSSITGVYISLNAAIDVPELTSSIIGLGTAGYISSSQLTSSIAGVHTSLNAAIDVAELTSSIIGLGTAGYISSTQLISTTEGILNAGVGGVSLVSTVAGLGTAGYISSSQLISTVAGIGVGGVTKITAGSNITISPVGGTGNVTINATGGGGGGTSFASFSTALISSISGLTIPNTTQLSYLYYSTVDYVGNTYSSPTQYSHMSTVSFKIDSFSSYITSSANVYIGLQYNYLFSSWEPPTFVDATFSSGPPPAFITDLTPFIQPFVGFSTTLLIGETPGNFIYDKYSPNLVAQQANISLFFPGCNFPQQYFITPSNSYTQHQILEVPKISFENLYTSTFSLYHVLDHGLQSLGLCNSPTVGVGNLSGFSGFSSPTVNVYIGSNNPVSIYITN